ncbi:hypothetical protein LV457_19090 [Mycobacterium sp. MYCO198283]|uniref:hypothetical protein n=1 Tax=Mycobacterium sp. MYCO198283 TaxID=2883505 RepID=UPI001E65DCFF|nr:hypothetical protein [Mycobacterium sp. MYCO198283]MCG5434381.1 hypothetical protein [Mycobacterium sp. MYCO198283]
MLTFSSSPWAQLADFYGAPDTERPAAGAEPRPPARAPARRMRTRAERARLAGLVVASLATVAVVAVTLPDWRDGPPTTPTASSPTASTPTAGAPPAAPGPAPASTAARAPAAPAMDDHGFVGTPARCAGAAAPVVSARTRRSVLVVCRAPNGRLAYTGVRLQDGAVLHLDDVRPVGAGFVADNDGASYDISARELLVRAGDAVLRREPMVEYRRN